MKIQTSGKTLVLAAIIALSPGTFAAADAPPPGAGNAVTDWNDVALQVLPQQPGLVLDARAFAIVHAAFTTRSTASSA